MKANVAGRFLVAGLVAGALLATSACGDDGTTITTPDGTVKVDKDGSDFTVEGSDGTKVEGGTELPDGFPEEVRLVEGRIIQALRAEDAGGGGFSVSVEVDGDVGPVADDAIALLEDAGFTDAGYQASTADAVTTSLTSATWQVLVMVTSSGDDGTVYVSYTVAPASS